MKIYSFGDCIPESIKIYNKLKKQGKKPLFVEGWIETTEPPDDLMPDMDFLELYQPEKIKYIDDDYYIYIKAIQHTWVICNNKIIDITINQFDKLGGLKYYYEKGRYYYKGDEPVTLTDLDIGAGEVWENSLRIYNKKGGI